MLNPRRPYASAVITLNWLSVSSGMGKKNGGKPAPISQANAGWPRPSARVDELGGAALDHQSLGRVGAVVVVEPDEVDRAPDARGVERRRLLAQRHVVKRGDFARARRERAPLSFASSAVAMRCSWNSAQSTCHARSSAFSASKITGGLTRSKAAARSPYARKQRILRAVLLAQEGAGRGRSRRGGSPDRRARRGSRARPRCRSGRARSGPSGYRSGASSAPTSASHLLGLVEECFAGVARHRKADRHDGQHHRVVGAASAPGTPDPRSPARECRSR